MPFIRSCLAAALLIAVGANAASAQGAGAGDPIVPVAPESPADLGGLPYVNRVLIGARDSRPDEERPLCAGDSIWVRVSGTLPSACHSARLELVPSPIASPLPQPPIFRIVVTVVDCEGPCREVLGRLHVEAVLPPLFEGDHGLIVQVADGVCPDTTATDETTYQARFPFTVGRCGDPPRVCVAGGWLHRGPTLCDDFVSPEHPAKVTFTVRSRTPLAALEGAFRVWAPSDPRVSGPPLEIVAIEPVGPAVGMRLLWRQTADGARFALFAEEGAPIPGTDDLTRDLPPQPILELTLEPARRPLPPQTFVVAGNLLGADEHGAGVPECLDPTLAIVRAVICADQPPSCDFNGDGRLDVRDLVLMIRCLRDPALDPGTTPACDTTRIHDCDADGRRDLADVICCARQLLRASACPDCPRDTLPPPGEVRAILGEPRLAGDEIVVPLALRGRSAIGGAIVRLVYPADRYQGEIESLDVPGMLDLAESAGGEASVGLVRLDGADDPGPLDTSDIALLRLRLRPGASHGGTVTIANGEFSGRDGEPIAAILGPGAPLGPGRRIALSEGRPNPTSGEASFELTLDRASNVTLAVFDLGGRHVATLHDGPLAAGSHPFVWSGAGGGGRAAPSGIYFVRATTQGAQVTRKVIRLGE